MPLTAAEKQKRYRERMRENNPEKFNKAKLKNAARNRERKRISECTKSEKEILREQWRKRKNKQKNKLKENIAQNKSNNNNNDNKEEIDAENRGQAMIKLTPLQKKLYSILQQDVGDPLPGISHNPPIHRSNDASVDVEVAESSSNYENIVNLLNESNGDSVDLEVAESNSSYEDLAIEKPSKNMSQNVKQDEHIQCKSESSPSPESQTDDESATLEFVDISDFRKNLNKENSKKNKRIPNKKESECEPTMKDMMAVLHSIQKINADGILVHAAAVNRLAAAIEQVVERLHPAASMSSARASPTRKRRRQPVDGRSDSD